MLVDPPGSALYHYVKDGELKSDGGSSITEGIGTGRVTANLEGAPIDDALRITDAETVHFVYRLLREEGLLLGSTAGINVAAAVQIAREQWARAHHCDRAVRRRRQVPIAPVQPGVDRGARLRRRPRLGAAGLGTAGLGALGDTRRRAAAEPGELGMQGRHFAHDQERRGLDAV